ncbi:NADH dehydrogenase [ubiquinone] 1 alpha subcomplex subunit 2 [Auxenochlorella protothecoides]|uniref:NADH dehydrogenase [ubiquinone] 1 alpha subcomplex subunit 2 n=1 Tax=Auxenochlorella protothecoides TaxID=3075 RepID=A0A087ST28_AUXPR|nr:NADH dehydrogenase [ubiquinone] 1 alpha subcomplex subunit 2 [Auxenochlorella protothecoides]KFM28882.1 NADH dehydrogenase [ubiquinone] 1 alpha subcomplex subunit 2 [Auxenochlorella protothecoides]RMZ53680.1 hypothetical protein APUTEX25_003214 [Auxenochlorella protothecoides]|eukprot:RMZ53680.1 hypothetical protein APUTEX25_003214 [Auxenochlorella protothecoides]
MAWKSLLTKNLQELRDFIFGSYKDLKKANPNFPILIREASGVEAKLIARYDLGVEKTVSIDGLPAADISKQLEALVTKA